jgi:streptogramin lyase
VSHFGRSLRFGWLAALALLLVQAASDKIQVAAGSDGALWFTETTGNKIGRITTGP